MNDNTPQPGEDAASIAAELAAYLNDVDEAVARTFTDERLAASLRRVTKSEQRTSDQTPAPAEREDPIPDAGVARARSMNQSATEAIHMTAVGKLREFLTAGVVSGDIDAGPEGRDEARVGGMFGVVNGNVNIYDVGSSATPEEKFDTALNLLDGNMPRRAEELIEEAVEGGHRNHRVAYYWALAVLSGRSFDDLGPDEFQALQRCSLMVVQDQSDPWLETLHVITNFINCLIVQEHSGDLTEADLDPAIQDYDNLPEERREEIRRHLGLIMTGALQDQLDVRYAAEATKRRMAGDRTGRAWKFFAPIPVPPEPRTLIRPELSRRRRSAAVAGAVLAGLGLAIVFILTVTAQPMAALVFAAATGGGGYLLATRGRAWVVARDLIAVDDARHGLPRSGKRRYAADAPEEGTDDRVWVESDKGDDQERDKLWRRNSFRNTVQPWVNAWFAGQNPTDATKRNEWWEATAGIRTTLAADIQRRFGGSDVMVDQLAWLITWRVGRTKKAWEAGELRADRDRLEEAAPSRAMVTLGVAGVGLGLLSGLAAVLSTGFGLGLLMIPTIAAGAWAVYKSEIDVFFVQQDVHAAQAAIAAAEFAEEQKAFERWTQVLEDRPTDAEMARWLDHDKLYAKELAMKACGLTNRDLVAHAILTEARSPCLRARVLFGPPRYSRYRVIVFLLTEAGVRQVSLNLDFFDGTVGNQQRNNFPYTMISSARVHAVGVRFDAGRRKVVIIDDESGDKEQYKDVDSLILSQAFRLSLVDGQHTHIIVENFDHGFLDRLREDKASLFELALDNSGVKGALRVLESVAVEGREWLSQERIRRTRRLIDLRRTFIDR
ncbi:hypothetical protein [Actinomadura napierensis]|uniref:Uncharacterized protein n=1 Tax=Actinomadura napierensis TaxID=267854 RepID=A0ABN3AF62_9ACTN